MRELDDSDGEPDSDYRRASDAEELPRQPESRHLNTRRLLYLSHFLSAWNSRLFEFGAFLFLATIYPRTLLPASIYALARASSAAILSPWVGRFIDNAERLHVIRLSIIGQRIAVAASCVLLYALAEFYGLRRNIFTSYGVLSILSILACVEKLCAVGNTVSVERDWVVIIAQQDEQRLQIINSQMRRIDLFCKLIAPLLIAFIDSASTKLAIIVTGALTAFSISIEYFAIAKVYRMVPELKIRSTNTPNATSETSRPLLVQLRQTFTYARSYFTHKAFLPSFSLTLLYLTVLSFSGQMVTYLLAIGVPSSMVGVFRGISAIFELSATWIAPKVMHRIGPIRAGIWFINWQIICVTIACLCLWIDFSSTAAAAALVAMVIASRVGLWGFDLSVQIIVQEEVEAAARGTFSSQEFAFQNAFEMLSFISTIVFSRPAQFKLPATISAGAVGSAGVLYAAFVRGRRGHLVHLSSCLDCYAKGTSPIRRRQGWLQIAQDEESAHMLTPRSPAGAEESNGVADIVS